MNHASVDKISCRQALALVAEYLDKELGQLERAQLEQHIELCRQCFDRFEFERLLKARLTQLQRVEPSEPLRKRVELILEQF